MKTFVNYIVNEKLVGSAIGLFTVLEASWVMGHALVRKGFRMAFENGEIWKFPITKHF